VEIQLDPRPRFRDRGLVTLVLSIVEDLGRNVADGRAIHGCLI
jgi:hypothetical protein